MYIKSLAPDVFLSKRLHTDRIKQKYDQNLHRLELITAHTSVEPPRVSKI